MKVSILITSYNNADCIENTVKSVLAQTGDFEKEVLIGDDGSNDGTDKILENFRRLYPQAISIYTMDRDPQNSTKSGFRAARNRANLLRKATGDYINFLDGDDEFTCKEKIAKQLAVFSTDDDKSIACVAHNILANDIVKGQKYQLVDSSQRTGRISSRKYWNKMYFHSNSILFRKECVSGLLKNDNVDLLNDNFITYIVLQYGDMYYLSDTMAMYNITGNGLWTGNKRTYGCVRNLLIYDAERRINRSFRKESLRRHLYDIEYLSNHKDEINMELLTDLAPYINREKTHTTYLMTTQDRLDPKEKLEKLWLLVVSRMYTSILQVVNLPQRLIKH